MTISVPLAPDDEAKLAAFAYSKGMSTGTLVKEALEKILAEVPDGLEKPPVHSSRGILAKYGPAPSAEEIDQNRAEMFRNFARD